MADLSSKLHRLPAWGGRIGQAAAGVLVDDDTPAEIGKCPLRARRPVADLAAGPDRRRGARMVRRDSACVDQFVGVHQVATQADGKAFMLAQITLLCHPASRGGRFRLLAQQALGCDWQYGVVPGKRYRLAATHR